MVGDYAAQISPKLLRTLTVGQPYQVYFAKYSGTMLSIRPLHGNDAYVRFD